MAYKLIQTRSPFYVQYSSTEPLVTCALTMWTGLISAKPVTASYTLSREPISGEATFEIAELVRGFISHTSTTEGRVWVEVVTSDGVGATVTDTHLATEGYTIFTEGLQHEGTINTSEGYMLPIESDNGSTITYRHLLPDSTAGTVPTLTYTATNAGTDSTASQITSATVTSGSTSISKTENSKTHVVYIDRFNCSKHEAVKLSYINKRGGMSDFYFTLKSTESLSQSSDSFNRSLTDVNNLSANNSLHAHRKRIISSKQSFTINTDWISEYYVKQIEEIFLSEFVWITYNGVTFPVNLDDNGIVKKSHVNDKLINYTMNVTTAANYINDVR